MNLSDKNDFLQAAFENSQNMIQFADSKAGIALTVQSLLVTLGIAGSIISETFQKIGEISLIDINVFYIYLSTLILFIIFSLMGVLLSIFVFKPRNSKEPTEKQRQGIFFFGHIVKFRNSDEYYNKVKKLTEGELIEEFCHQIYQIAHIANKKMRIVNISFYFLLINIILTIIFLVMTIWIQLI